MTTLSTITHPRDEVEKKVNFFVDYFKFYNRRIGNLHFYRFDTPLQIIDKMRFQVTNNFDNGFIYFSNHLDRLSKDDFELISKCSTKHKFIRRLQEVHRSNKKMQLILWKSRRLKLNLNELYLDLDSNQTNYVVEAITNLLGCKHKLATHREGLIYLSGLLVSLFRYKGLDRREIDEKLASIFSRDIYTFPFPTNIEKIEDKDHRHNQKQNYISTRNFKQQFDGLKTSLEREPYKSKAIFKLENISYEHNESLSVRYGSMELVSFNDPRIQKLVPLCQKNDLADDFFEGDNFMLIIADVYRYSSKNDSQLYSTVESGVEYIKSKLNSPYPKLNTRHYLITNNFEQIGTGRLFEPSIARIRKYDRPRLQNNAFMALENANYLLSTKLIYLEDLFQRAERTNDPAEYWRYLENLVPLDKNNQKQVKSLVSRAITKLYKKELFLEYREFFINELANSFDPDRRNEILGSQKDLYMKRKYDELDYHEIGRRIGDNAFVKLLLKYMRKHPSRANHESYTSYVKGILTEAYELRNMIIHTGEFNDNLHHKIKVSFPGIVRLFRQFCIQAVLNAKNRNHDFDKLIMSKIK